MPFSKTTRRGSLAAVALLAACAEPTAPRAAASDAPPLALAATRPATPASVEWNATARGIVARTKASVFVAFRTYALTSVAQREAVKAAERASTRRRPVSSRAAAAAASVVVLKYVFPAEAPLLDSLAAAQLATAGWVEPGADVAAGVAAGRVAAEAVVAHARTDRFFEPWTGTVPTGPGKWFSSTVPATPPAAPTLGGARPWLLASSDQFRPPPPPAFGSPAFNAALAEVRRIADARTPQQDSIAKFWAFGAGTYTPPGYWNEEAARLIVARRLDERRAADVLALMNMIAMDAIIASHEAKYVYWLLRPSHADPAITTSFTVPNFPAYASNHAAISMAMAEVLSAAFPREARRLRADAQQAALSRVYGGIHYRFDGDAGLVLGRKVARWGMKRAGAAHGVHVVSAPWWSGR